MSFPRYPAYKDSGVEWLGEVPEHWQVHPIKNLASIVNGYPFDSALFDAAEGVPLIRIRDLDKSEAETFYKGDFVAAAAITSDDVLIGMDGDFNVGRWRGEGIALLNQRMCCVRGKSDVLTRILEYTLPVRLKAINDVTYATTVKHLASSQVEKTFVVVPPEISEQIQIATFLDHETAKIDALVAEQRRLMELLKEKRQAVISHAVTRGLNPDAPMKPSGIEWLGDVPAHWELRRVKSVSTFTTSGPRGWSERVGDEGALFVQSGDLNQTLGVDFANSKRVNVTADAEAARTLLNAGDVVVCITGAKTGNVAVCPSVPEAAYINQHLCLIRPNSAVLPVFLGVLLKSNLGQTYFDFSQYGLKQGLSLEDVREAPVALPPIAEQSEIIRFVEAESTRFDTLTTEAQRAIDLLQERRTALISAAVTGQIDVRGAVQSF